MGLFDLFKGGGGDKPKAKITSASKWADRIEKRAQNYDRQEAINTLSEMASADAVEVLLKRFSFHIDPSITDQEEKDAAFRGVLKADREAIAPVRAYAAKAESLAWPMKIMGEILGPDEYVEELVRWLERWDTEYSKFIDPKLQILVTLEERKHPAIRPAVERFLEDVNEPARFHAATALLMQDDAAAAAPLATLLGDEESLRVRTRIAEGMSTRGWTVPEESRDAVRKSLPPAFSLDGSGRIVKR